MVRLKRAYEAATPGDGHRVLVERLWPRGLRKEQAHFDEWRKEIAPSDPLRKWFHHDPERWPEFAQRYARELESEPARAVLSDLVRRAAAATLTLIYSAHDEEHNNAVVLKRMIERRLRHPPRRAARPAEDRAPTRSRPRARLERLVDEEIRESFPASDPPTWTSMHAGGPSRQSRAKARSSSSSAGRRSHPAAREKRSPAGSSR